MPQPVQIFKSSAGSGKTYTLVREYLGLALAHPERYRQLLAITFTNKASAEMKDRIIKALRELSSDQNPGLAKVISELNTISLAQIKANAAIILSHILHDYANFAVSTIDSFTSRIVRNFAHDLELPSRFDVESDTTLLLDKMIDRLMDQVGRDDYVTQVLVNFSEEKLAEKGNWNLEKDLNSVSREIFQEGSRPYLEGIKNLEGDRFLHYMAEIKEKIQAYRNEIMAHAERCIAFLDQSGLSDADFKGGSNSVAKYIRMIPKAKKPKDYSELFSRKVVQEAALSRTYTAQKGNPLVEAAVNKGLGDAVEALYQYHQDRFPAYVTAYYAYQNIHSLGVLQQVEEYLEDYKAQNNVVHISDFQRKISKFIQSESADYIYWRLGERYKFFMLDEFQDTSELQWKNLFPLFENLVAESEPDGSVLLVGDSKQAIYRWRGGEVELLEMRAPEELGVEPEVLGTNWRSGEYIVDFNNVFFNTLRDLLPENGLAQLIYADFHQNYAQAHEGMGYVQLKGFEREGFRDKAKGETLATIQRALQDGFALGDIAILVRSANDGADVARMLAEENIPVISSDSLLLHKEPAVAFLVNVLRYLANPSDQVARANVLHYKLFYLDTPTTVASGILDFDKPFLDEAPLPYLDFQTALQAEEKFAAFRDQMPEEFRRLSFKLDKTPLYELVEETVRIFGLNRIAQTYVQQFLDVVLDFTNRRRSDLDGFLDYWNDQKGMLAISVPQGMDAIEILTIHKSKGLEFPVVIIPFANWSMNPKADSTFWAETESAFSEGENDAFLVPPNAELNQSLFAKSFESERQKTALDNVNLLYVAFTRARERLYVYYLEKPDPKTAKGAQTAPPMVTVGDAIKAVRKAALESGAVQVTESYERGMEQPPHASRKPKGATLATELLSLPWHKRIRMEKKHKKHWTGSLSALQQNAMGIPLETVAAEALRRLDTADDLAKVLKDLVEEGLLQSRDHMSLRIKLDRILAEEKIKLWYAQGAEVRKEAEILTEDAELYHPSRLVIQHPLAHVVDFVVADEGNDLRKYQQTYAKNLRKMGFKKVELHIFDIGTETFLDS